MNNEEQNEQTAHTLANNVQPEVVSSQNLKINEDVSNPEVSNEIVQPTAELSEVTTSPELQQPKAVENQSGESLPHTEVQGSSTPQISHVDETSSAVEVSETPKKKHFIRFPKSKKGWIMFTIISLLILSGIAAGGWYFLKYKNTTSNQALNYEPISNPFAITSTSPLDKSTGVKVDDKIVISFSRAVDFTKAKDDFFISPLIEGDYSQGETANDIVFTPKRPFDQPAIISLMIHGEFKSVDGTPLGADYFMSFETSVPGDKVAFESLDYITELTSLPANQKGSFKIMAGSETLLNNALKLYKADVNALLSAFTYSMVKSESSDFEYKLKNNGPINTSVMTLLDTKNGFNNGDEYEVNRGSGIYYLEATSNGMPKGGTWIVYGDNSVVVRQDDQKLYAVALNSVTGESLNGSIALYRLNGKPTIISSKKINGLSTIDTAFGDEIDCAVVTINGEEMFVPLNMLSTLADIRVKEDLSKKNIIYATTDKPVYESTDTVKIAGFERVDNDAQYTLPSARTLQLDVFRGFELVSTIDASINKNGVLTSEFPLTSLVDQSYAINIFGIRTKAGASIAAFRVLNKAKSPQSFLITTGFDKKSYIGNETPTFQIGVKKSDNSPYANQSIKVSWYQKEYREGDSVFNDSSVGTLGAPLAVNGDYDNPVTSIIKLDASGNGSIAFPKDKLSAENSLVISGVISLEGDINGAQTQSSSAVFHQGNYYISFVPSKTVFSEGEELVSRVLIRNLNGTLAKNVKVKASFISSIYNSEKLEYIDTVLATKSATTNDEGFVELRALPSSKITGTLNVVITASDDLGNIIQARKPLYVEQTTAQLAYSDLQLSKIDITGLSDEVKVGTNVPVTIVAPADMKALLTYERGRVLYAEEVSLKKGENSYTVKVTPDLAPGFTIVFSYINSNGRSVIEGVKISAINSEKQVSVVVNSEKTTYNKGDTATININTKNSKAVSAQLVVRVVDNAIFTVSDFAGADISGYFYGNREITTNGSSSRTGLGYAVGGKCGGGFFDAEAGINGLGTTLYHSAAITTDASGKAEIKVPLTKSGNWRVLVLAATNETAVGSGDFILSVN